MATRKTDKKKTRTNYPDDYKTEAVRLAQSIGTTAAAKELGIQTSQIYGWRNKQRVQASTTEIENRLLAENAKLKREVAEQKEELALLKKASAYFAKNLK